MIKTFRQVDTKGTDVNIMKAMYDKPQQTSFSMVKTKSIFSMIRNKTRMSTFTIFIQHSFRSPSHGNQRKRNKRSTNWKRRSKLSLSANSIILYIENPKNGTKKILELINEFGKAAGYNINAQKSLAFLYTNNKRSEREIKETIPLTIETKRIKYPGINLPIETKGLYSENYKTLMTKEIKDGTNRWRNIPCSWTRRINSVKMIIPP